MQQDRFHQIRKAEGINHAPLLIRGESFEVELNLHDPTISALLAAQNRTAEHIRNFQKEDSTASACLGLDLLLDQTFNLQKQWDSYMAQLGYSGPPVVSRIKAVSIAKSAVGSKDTFSGWVTQLALLEMTIKYIEAQGNFVWLTRLGQTTNYMFAGIFYEMPWTVFLDPRGSHPSSRLVTMLSVMMEGTDKLRLAVRKQLEMSLGQWHQQTKDYLNIDKLEVVLAELKQSVGQNTPVSDLSRQILAASIKQYWPVIYLLTQEENQFLSHEAQLGILCKLCYHGSNELVKAVAASS